jgi:hypothetical protein
MRWMMMDWGKIVYMLIQRHRHTNTSPDDQLDKQRTNGSNQKKEQTRNVVFFFSFSPEGFQTVELDWLKKGNEERDFWNFILCRGDSRRGQLCRLWTSVQQ